jgi:hypothetical protein
MVVIPSVAMLGMLLLTVAARWRHRNVARQARADAGDTCRFSLTDRFSDHHLINASPQRGASWLSEVFGRTATRFSDHTAIEVPHTGEQLTYAKLDRAAERVAALVEPCLTGLDHVVVVAMPQGSSHIVTAHLGVLRAGGVRLVLDTAVPHTLIEHMLTDAAPVLVLTSGESAFRDRSTVDVASLPELRGAVRPPAWRCQIDPVLQQVHFPGRVDAHLKVREHPVEMPESESAVVGLRLGGEGTSELVVATQKPAAVPSTPALPGAGHFFVRGLSNDILRVSLLPIGEVLVYTLLVIALVGSGTTPLVAALGATIMGGAMIAADSTIESHAFVLSDMQLAAGRFRGSRVECVDAVETENAASCALGGGLHG